jgi:hypothetical protein
VLCSQIHRAAWNGRNPADPTADAIKRRVEEASMIGVGAAAGPRRKTTAAGIAGLLYQAGARRCLEPPGCVGSSGGNNASDIARACGVTAACAAKT